MIPKTLPEQIAWIAEQVAELRRQARNRKRTGKVVEVDHKKGLARVEISRPDDKPFISPWVPWKEVASGGIKSHIPPTVGEQVDLVSESGDLTDAVIDMSTPSNANPRPHDGPEAVITKGESRFVISDDTVSVEAPLINLTARETKITGDLVIEGGSVTHNGTNIGDSHVHGGVERGGSDTNTPH